MMNSNQQNSNTGGPAQNAQGTHGTQGGQQNGEPDYYVSGQDKVLESSSAAVPAPSMTEEQRLSDPGFAFQSTGETPGAANPALAETIGEEEGRVSTADLLRARETAEETPVLARGLPTYEDQSTTGSPRADEFQNAEGARPNWPDDRREDPAEYMTSPRANAPFGSGLQGNEGLNEKGLIDAAVDRNSTQASKNESHSGLPAVGFDSEEDKYEHREFENVAPPSEMDEVAPGMVNLPPEDSNG